MTGTAEKLELPFRQVSEWSRRLNGGYAGWATGSSWLEAPLYGHSPKAVFPLLGSADQPAAVVDDAGWTALKAVQP